MSDPYSTDRNGDGLNLTDLLAIGHGRRAGRNFKLIMGVAVKRRSDGKVFSLPRPARHCHILNSYWKEHGERLIGNQGFIASDGKFYDRKHAKVLAKKAGQLLDRAGDGPFLFSEDVW